MGRLGVILAAVLFSTGGAAIKVEAFDALQVSSLRSGIAALFLFAWWRSRAGGEGRAARLVVSPATLGAAVVYAATLTLFVQATKLTTAANAIFLQSAAPIYVLLLAPFALGERLRVRDLPYVLAIVTGMAMCFAGQPPVQATAPDPSAGNLFAVLSGVAWAATLIGLRHVQRERPGGQSSAAGMSAVIAGNVFACAIALPFAWPLPAAPAAEWGTIVYLGVVQIGLAYVLLTRAIAHVPAIDASLLLLLEPALNPLWTWLMRGEQPGTWTVAGGVVILSAATINALAAERYHRRTA